MTNAELEELLAFGLGYSPTASRPFEREKIVALANAAEILAAEVVMLRGALRKAAPFVGWASTREQVVAGVYAADLCDEIDAALASQPGHCADGDGR